MLLTKRYAHITDSIRDIPELFALFDDVPVYDAKTLLINEHHDLSNGIYIASEETPLVEILRLYLHCGVNHILHDNRPDFLYNILASSTILKMPDRFIANPFPFFIRGFHPANYPPNTRYNSVKLNKSVDKDRVMVEIEKFLLDDPLTANSVEKSFIIADELLTNAFFHGPVDREGVHIHSNKPRDEQITIAGEIEFFMCHNNEQLLIGCDDPFGSLTFGSVINHLINHFDANSPTKNQVRRDGVGAGLGLKIVIEASSSFYLLVKRNTRTFVCSALPLGTSQKEAKKVPKSLHFTNF